MRPKDTTEFVACERFDVQAFNSLKQDGIMVAGSPPPAQTMFCEYVGIGNKYFIRKCYKHLEWLDGDVINFDGTQEPIYRRLLPPPPETVNHTFIIKYIIENTAGHLEKTYIEYGVRSGENLATMVPVVGKAIGVDICYPPCAPTYEFHLSTTDDFSATKLPTLAYHFAFIDADHKFESCIRDFDNIYKYLQSGGYVFLHDTYPCAEVFLEPHMCNDCYKTPIAIKEKYPDIEILTLPLNPGLTIVRKGL